MVQGIRERVKAMSYRTKINGKQLFGNNEWYEEWGEYLISKGIEIDDEGLYEGELDNFMEALEVIEKITMNIEAKRRERKEAGGKFFSQSIFDNGDIYDSLVNDDEHYESLFDKEVEIIKYGYMFLPIQFFKACEDMLEYTGIDLKGNRTYTYKLKDGCKIKVTAG